MAPSLVEEMETKLVQEIAKKGVEAIPPKYLHEVPYDEAIDAPADLWTDTLSIDVSRLSTCPDELAKLKTALSTWGFFLAKNHGMDASFLDDVLESCRKFFGRPLEEKLKYAMGESPFHGYGSYTNFANDKTTDWSDQLYLALHPVEKRALQYWPLNPENFRELVEEYSSRVANLVEITYKAMARSLNLAEDKFLEGGKIGEITARIGLYPRCPCPDRVLGVSPHADGTTITVLLPQSEGLQILKDGQYYKVPVIPGTLVVNTGDLGEVMTNGFFKSQTHRVAPNSEIDRLSIAGFCVPVETMEIGPFSELINDENPRLFDTFTLSELKNRFFAKKFPGNRTIEAFKL